MQGRLQSLACVVESQNMQAKGGMTAVALAEAVESKTKRRKSSGRSTLAIAFRGYYKRRIDELRLNCHQWAQEVGSG